MLDWRFAGTPCQYIRYQYKLFVHVAAIKKQKKKNSLKLNYTTHKLLFKWMNNKKLFFFSLQWMNFNDIVAFSHWLRSPRSWLDGDTICDVSFFCFKQLCHLPDLIAASWRIHVKRHIRRDRMNRRLDLHSSWFDSTLSLMRWSSYPVIYTFLPEECEDRDMYTYYCWIDSTLRVGSVSAVKMIRSKLIPHSELGRVNILWLW